MPTIKVEVRDTLDERVADAIRELEDLLLVYLRENPDVSDTPDLYNDLDYDGCFHELVDSNVPIFTDEIKDTWYLYEDLLLDAYDDAGIGSDPHGNNGMTAIYLFIEQGCSQWYYENAGGIFYEWKEKQNER